MKNKGVVSKKTVKTAIKKLKKKKRKTKMSANVRVAPNVKKSCWLSYYAHKKISIHQGYTKDDEAESHESTSLVAVFNI